MAGAVNYGLIDCDSLDVRLEDLAMETEQSS